MEKLNIVHRDIKPENILLTSNEDGKFTLGDGKKLRLDLFDLRLADFGYAIHLPPKKESDQSLLQYRQISQTRSKSKGRINASGG